MKYPHWILDEVKLKKNSIKNSAACELKNEIFSLNQHTICYAAKCPNKGECFNSKHLTFMILGDRCTRRCRFCSVNKLKPIPPDPDEPKRVAMMVKKWNIKYAVFTSPTRDDLEDGGAFQFAEVINEIKKISPHTFTEPLIPDFSFRKESLIKVLNAGPSVLSHNIETVERLYPEVRPGSSYRKSLNLLSEAKRINPSIITKSSLIIGMGETEDEIRKTITELKEHECDILVIGQYLKPSQTSIDVAKYYHPDEFEKFRDFALRSGFKAVVSEPLARSSYKAYQAYISIKGDIWRKI